MERERFVMSVVSIIGKTPLIELKRLHQNPRVKILAKLKGNNPGGSVKDRTAYYMIAKAEESDDDPLQNHLGTDFGLHGNCHRHEWIPV